MLDLPKTPAGRLNGRLALITGATRGIGRAIALAYAAEGAHVIALGRTVGALEELDDEIKAKGGSATLVPFDLKEVDGLDPLGASLFQRWGKLDILVGNAGVLGTLSPMSHLPLESWAELVTINVTVNFRLMRSMEPLLRKSDAGRAIFVTSGAARKHTPFWGGYGMSKAALEAIALTWAAELETVSPIKVNLVSPGAIRTKMRATAMPGEDPMSLPTPEDVAPVFVALASPAMTSTAGLYNGKGEKLG